MSVLRMCIFVHDQSQKKINTSLPTSLLSVLFTILSCRLAGPTVWPDHDSVPNCLSPQSPWFSRAPKSMCAFILHYQWGRFLWESTGRHTFKMSVSIIPGKVSLFSALGLRLDIVVWTKWGQLLGVPRTRVPRTSKGPSMCCETAPKSESSVHV